MRFWLQSFQADFLALCLLALCLSVPGYASASAESDFSEGAEFFKAGDYKKAVQKFESARKQGMKTTALYYNLGSSYFKIEDYKKSEVYFKELSKQSKMKSLAEYNLGLIAEKQGDKAKADNYFKSVISANKDRKLVYLSKIKTGEAPSNRGISSKPWTLYTSAKIGYDDNIAFAPIESALNDSDSFLDLIISGEYLLDGSRNNGWIADVTFAQMNYADSNAYDQNQYGAGLKKSRKISSWDTYLKVHFDKYNYAHDDYQSIMRLDLWGKKSLSKAGRMYLRYRYEDITSDRAVYDYLEGWRQKLKAEYRHYEKDSIAQIYYELELNDRNDLVSTLTGNEYSYSPTRHTIRGKYTSILNQYWHLTGDVSYRQSDYPSTATQDRADDQWRASIYADYRIDRTMKVTGKVEYTDNDSNEVFYDYTRTVLSVGISKLF